MRGIYVHSPFCRKRCVYCDFYTVGERLADWPRYVSAVLAEARMRLDAAVDAPDGHHTLYFGGGTPSLMPADSFRTLSSGVLDLTQGSPDEFTIEVNPDDVTPALARVWQECGVDRISMGVQSFDDTVLSAIGRRHDAATAVEAYRILRDSFENISLDLMFGLPGQTLDSLKDSVERLVSLAPEHVSVYSLMYEERTALTALRDAGRIKEVSECESAAMFDVITDLLAQAGYEQYEISNYSLPGFRSRHNSLYWQGMPYVGLGPGAHSYDGARLRMANLPDLKRYFAYWCSGVGERPVVNEPLDDDQLREEMIMTRLRTREGLSLAEFELRFGTHATEELMKSAAISVKSGNTEINETGNLVLTRRGIMVSDDIISSLF